MRERLAAAAAAVDGCAEVPVWALSNDDLVSALDEVHRLEQRLAAVRLALVREVDGRNLGVEQGASSTAVWLRERLRVGVPAARRMLQLAKALDGGLPGLGAALAGGAVSVEQAQVIAVAVGSVPEDAGAGAADKAVAFLVQAGGQFDPGMLRRLGERILTVVAPEIAEKAERKALEAQERRAWLRRGLTLFPDGAGGVHLRGRLTVEDAAVVSAALDPLCAPRPSVAGQVDTRTAAERRADALVEICRLALGTGELPEHGGDRPQLVLTIDYHRLAGQLGAGSLDTGATLSPQVVRRLACDARLLPMVMGGAGQPLDVGRERRLITGALRRALLARDRGCAFPGCDRPPRWTEAHHIQHWTDGGATSLTNAVLVCRFHHRQLHHNGWNVHIAADGHPEFTPPAWIDPHQRPRRNQYHRRT